MGVTVKFSDAVNTALGANAAKDQDTVQKDLNRGLEERAKKDAGAKDLLDSGQTLKIVCFDEKAAKDAGLSKPDGGIMAGVAGLGATKGEFDAAGKPKKNGTAIIAIDCDLLKANGWSKPLTLPGDTQVPLFHALVHELLHASNEKRKHPPDDLSIYDDWVKKFVEAMKDAPAAKPPKDGGKKKSKKKPKRRAKKKAAKRRRQAQRRRKR